MTFFGILKIGPLEPCGNEFQSTGSHRLTVCTSTDSYYYFSAYTWGQKRNTFPQGSSGSIFKIPKNVISYEPTEPTFEWAKLFCDISLTLLCNQCWCWLPLEGSWWWQSPLVATVLKLNTARTQEMIETGFGEIQFNFSLKYLNIT